MKIKNDSNESRKNDIKNEPVKHYRNSSFRDAIPLKSYLEISKHNQRLHRKLHRHFESIQQTQSHDNGFPRSYNQTKLVLMVRDPYWIYVYWDLDIEKKREIDFYLKNDTFSSKAILRFYDLTVDKSLVDEKKSAKPDKQTFSFDVEVPLVLGEWYVYLGHPNHTYKADLGLLNTAGTFYLITWSNNVTLPSDSPSSIVDDKWHVTDDAFQNLYSKNESDMHSINLVKKKR
jgi:hypothetical protein